MHFVIREHFGRMGSVNYPIYWMVMAYPLFLVMLSPCEGSLTVDGQGEEFRRSAWLRPVGSIVLGPDDGRTVYNIGNIWSSLLDDSRTY